MRRRAHRILRLVILSLVLAHITTWAVAWGAAWISARTNSRMRLGGSPAQMALLSGHTEVYRETFLIADLPPDVLSSHVRTARRASAHHRQQRWGVESEHWYEGVMRTLDREKYEAQFIWQYGEYATGWPQLSHMCWSTEPDYFLHNETIRGGIAIRYQPSTLHFVNPPPFRALPYLPIYRGLIINTLFYTLLWLQLIFFTSRATRALKHRARSARGQCRHCKYDLNGITSPNCPECGLAAPSPAAGGGGAERSEAEGVSF